MKQLISYSLSFVCVFLLFTTVILGEVKQCDFTKRKQDCFIKASAEDQIILKCAFKEDSGAHIVSDENEIPRCFNFVNPLKKMNENFVPLLSLLPGAYGFHEETEDALTTMSVIIPPVIPMAVDFKCFCEQSISNETDTKTIQRVLTVSIDRGNDKKLVGCNFTGYVSKYKYMQNMSRYNHVCNVTASSADTLGLLCPTGYRIDPPTCFDEVYTYQFDNVLEVSRPTTWKKISIQEILGNRTTMSLIGKDSRVIYSTLPKNVTAQSIFMCRCIAENEEDYIMNVYLNKKFARPGRDGMSLSEEGINRIKQWVIGMYLNNKKKQEEQTNKTSTNEHDEPYKNNINTDMSKPKGTYLVEHLASSKSKFCRKLQALYYNLHIAEVYAMEYAFKLVKLI